MKPTFTFILNDAEYNSFCHHAENQVHINFPYVKNTLARAVSRVNYNHTLWAQVDAVIYAVKICKKYSLCFFMFTLHIKTKIRNKHYY